MSLILQATESLGRLLNREMGAMRSVSDKRRRWGPGNLGDDFVFPRGPGGKPEPSSRGEGDGKRDSGGGRHNTTWWLMGPWKEGAKGVY